MNKPASELIALADDLSFAAENTQGCLYSQRKMLHAAADALRTAADAYPRWRHKKRGTTYAEIGRGSLQASDGVIGDGESLVIYRSDDDGSLWARPFNEFHDGRFEALATPPAQPAPASDEASTKGCDCGVMCQDLRDGCRYRPSEAPATNGKPDGAVREAITYLRNLEEYMMEHDIDMKMGDQRPPSCVADELEAALHSPKIAAAETSPGDVLAMKEALRQHWLTHVICDHDAKMDRAACFCGWVSDVEPNVGAAVEAWIDHAIDRLDVKAEATAGTPAARWRAEGEPDPHGNRFNGERSALCGGSMTDDEVANAVYLNPSIMNLTAAKERIRWLSRKLCSTHPTTKPEAPAVSVDAVLTRLNSIAPAVENLACNQEQADMDGCMVKVSRQALDETLEAVNAIAALIVGER